MHPPRSRAALIAFPVLASGAAALAVVAALYFRSWLPIAVLFALAGFLLLLAIANAPLGRFAARSRMSIRWKVTGAIMLILAIFFAVTLFTVAELQHTHDEVHRIIPLAGFRPPEVTAAIERADSPQGELLRRIDARRGEVIDALARLERTQHQTLFLTPAVVAVGGIAAIAFGIALSGSLVPTIQSIGEATRRISRGDFGTPVDVENRDELGELAAGLNAASKDLARLQQALVAEERARALRERVSAATRAQEDERRRLSRELHDGLGPSLAGLSHRLGDCRQVLRQNPGAADAILDEVTGLLRLYVVQIRELSHELRPPDLDQLGLVEAVRLYVDRFGRESNIAASLQVSGDPPADPLAEVTVFKVLQESLVNVQTHSGARRVTITLRSSPESTSLTVEDDGRGFDVRSRPTTDGVGLSSMRERADLIGGTLEIVSHPGQGCRVTLTMRGEYA